MFSGIHSKYELQVQISSVNQLTDLSRLVLRTGNTSRTGAQGRPKSRRRCLTQRPMRKIGIGNIEYADTEVSQ